MPAEILANVIRGHTVESLHRGHVFAVDGEGNTLISIGEPETVTYFRSAAKAFQFIPCITSGAAEAFGITDEEVALAVGSHSGEPRHVEIAEAMLVKAGFSESDLRCGTHRPFNEGESHRMLREGVAPTQLHNNCSGKHAAMLAFARHIGADPATYDLPGNRIQKRILRCVSDFTLVPKDRIATGTDGCGVPNFAISVKAMARGFANLVFPLKFPASIQDAAKRTVAAMIRFPELIGGVDRLDTLLMQAAHGKIISKVGADGVWLCGVLPSEKYPTGLGLALKVEDGDDHRSRPVIAVEILRQLGTLNKTDLPDLSPMPIKNRRKEPVGEVTAVPKVIFVKH